MRRHQHRGRDVLRHRGAAQRLGLDSLGGMELRLGLEQRLGMPVPEDVAAAALMAAHEPAATALPAVRAA